ncbi:MAG TPA: hypothetical protein VMI52_05715 [Acetobacteraceae bacterium]|nr:hypothetical protein [Acetobacteraceae bacterium]
MFQTICDLIPRDPDYPERTRTLDLLRRVLDGTLYDALPYAFHEERTAGGEYVPLRLRRPAVRYALSRVVVEDSVALLFSEGHFPRIDSPDRAVRDLLAAVAREARLNLVMTEAALRGAVGSVALWLRVLRGRVFVSVLDTAYLTPVWQPEAPDTLASVTERYKVSGAALVAQGYEIADVSAVYWFMRRWDAEREVWFLPQPVGASGAPVEDEARSVRHGLGFVPLVWVRNLPGGNGIDGACTFRAAVETGIEIDYQLSQAGRGLKYSSDPTLLIREPAGVDGDMVRGAANALVVSEKGDAKLLEIGGTAAEAVIGYVRTLREFALESVHGNRSDASRLSAAASGRALELMNQGLIWLADNLRVSYGEGGLLQLARMILRAGQRYALRVGGQRVEALDAEAPLSLVWPDWYPPTAADREAQARTLTTLVGARQISRETALAALAGSYGITDIPGELARIADEAGAAGDAGGTTDTATGENA